MCACSSLGGVSEGRLHPKQGTCLLLGCIAATCGCHTTQGLSNSSASSEFASWCSQVCRISTCGWYNLCIIQSARDPARQQGSLQRLEHLEGFLVIVVCCACGLVRH